MADLDVPRRKSELTLHDEMLDRAEHALRGLGFEAPDVRDCAEAVILAAFEGVPMTNYSIGTLLQFFSHVICVKGGGTGVYVPNGTEDGFDSLAHNVRFTYRKNGALSTLMFSKMGDEPK